MTPNSDNADKYRVKSLDHALDVVEALAHGGREGLAVTEVATTVGMSKSSAYSILQTLLRRGFVASHGTGPTRRYRLGLSFAYLGDQVTSQTGLREVAMPYLEELTRVAGLTSRLAIFDEGYAVAIGRIDGPGTIRIAPFLGRRELPHATAIGKAMLSTLGDDEVRTIIESIGLPARGPNTIVDIDTLLHDLHRSAERGYAVDDEEDTAGVVCIGASVLDRTGTCVGAISVTALKHEMRADAAAEIGTLVRRYADTITTELGGR
ncbi:IclR family transcriptional regulator [Sphaerisporangium sp. NPDC049002]|uniref:IclR family transcriptional regulator n=1 Tax=unclassified Sphaerisporangium TaxID=2630420 RepID=UPI0033C30739